VRRGTGDPISGMYLHLHAIASPFQSHLLGSHLPEGNNSRSRAQGSQPHGEEQHGTPQRFGKESVKAHSSAEQPMRTDRTVNKKKKKQGRKQNTDCLNVF